MSWLDVYREDHQPAAHGLGGGGGGRAAFLPQLVSSPSERGLGLTNDRTNGRTDAAAYRTQAAHSCLRHQQMHRVHRQPLMSISRDWKEVETSLKLYAMNNNNTLINHGYALRRLLLASQSVS